MPCTFFLDLIFRRGLSVVILKRYVDGDNTIYRFLKFVLAMLTFLRFQGLRWAFFFCLLNFHCLHKLIKISIASRLSHTDLLLFQEPLLLRSFA